MQKGEIMKKTMLAVLLATLLAHSVEESKIQTTTDSKVREVLSILKNKALPQGQKDTKTVKIIDEMFDFKIMSQISLGRKWRGLSSSEKSQFSKAFEKKIKKSYLDKLRLYNNQKVEIKKYKKTRPNRISLETTVIGVDENYKVEYLFYKKKGRDDWLVYDVELVGVSIVQTYRKQFAEFLAKGTVKELIKTL